MTKEDKKLLLKDLCARLPYGVIVGYSTKDNPNTLDKIARVIYVDIRFGMIQMQVESGISYGLSPSEFIKPYLRPMSSMTEEENEEFEELFISYSISQDRNCVYHASRGDLNLEIIDWLNAHHFDYRGLIDKGLALEAQEGMYNKQ